MDKVSIVEFNKIGRARLLAHEITQDEADSMLNSPEFILGVAEGGRCEVVPSDFRKANEAARREVLSLFPAVEEDEVGAFLLLASPYPFRPPWACMPALRELAARSGGDPDKAMSLVQDDIDEAMRNETPNVP